MDCAFGKKNKFYLLKYRSELASLVPQTRYRAYSYGGQGRFFVLFAIKENSKACLHCACLRPGVRNRTAPTAPSHVRLSFVRVATGQPGGRLIAPNISETRLAFNRTELNCVLWFDDRNNLDARWFGDIEGDFSFVLI